MQGSPTFLTGPTGLALLATATQAEALEAIGAEAAIEVVSNTNGTALRFPRILWQICTGRVQQPANVTDGVIATFPAAFSSSPTLVPVAEIRAAGNDSAFANAEFQEISGSQARLKLLVAFATSIVAPGAATWINYIAMGPYTP